MKVQMYAGRWVYDRANPDHHFGVVHSVARSKEKESGVTGKRGKIQNFASIGSLHEAQAVN